jgi:hypothetical protein
MRDLAEKWSAIPEWQSRVLETPGLTVRTLAGLNQLLVSGDLEAWNRKAGTQGPGVGALAVATGDPYAVRLARDRILAVGTSPFEIEPGWHDEGFAVTRLDAGLHVFQLNGPSLARVISRAVTLDPADAGPSAAMSFAGLQASVYRHRDDHTLRVHVDRGLAACLWTWLETACGAD